MAKLNHWLRKTRERYHGTKANLSGLPAVRESDATMKSIGSALDMSPAAIDELPLATRQPNGNRKSISEVVSMEQQQLIEVARKLHRLYIKETTGVPGRWKTTSKEERVLWRRIARAAQSGERPAVARPPSAKKLAK